MDILAKLFNITDSSSCLMGGILLDTDPSVGFNKNCMMNPKPQDNSISPKSGVFLYSIVKELYDTYEPTGFKNAMLDIWLNGFVVNHRGIASPNVISTAGDVLTDLSLLKTSQIFSSIDKELKETLFYFFSFYGTQNRVLSLDSFTIENKIKLIEKGVVSQKWHDNPLPIRYIIKKEKVVEDKDYLFFIGGSTDLIKDDPSESIDIIKELYHHISDSTKKKSLKKITHERFWREWDDQKDQLSLEPGEEKTLRNYIRFHRILTGITHIRNHLKYTLQEVGIDSLVEFNSNGPKKIKVKKVLDLYEEVYQYCKTISILM